MQRTYTLEESKIAAAHLEETPDYYSRLKEAMETDDDLGRQTQRGWNMRGVGVIPAIRVRDMAKALDFYQLKLGFNLARGGPDEDHCSLDRGDAHIMLEVPSGLYSPGYNEAIGLRMASPSAMAIYIEAPDLEALYGRVESEGVKLVDSLADRPCGQVEFTVEDPEGNWLTFWQASQAARFEARADDSLSGGPSEGYRLSD